MTLSVAAPEASIITKVVRVRNNKGSIWPYSRPVALYMSTTEKMEVLLPVS